MASLWLESYNMSYKYRLHYTLVIFLFEFLLSKGGWVNTYGADEIDGANHILKLSDGFLITGFTTSFGNGGNDLWVVRTDRNAKELWHRFYGGMGMDAGTKAVRTSDDGFIILAQTYSYGSGLADIWIVKIDSIGNKVWDKTFGNESTDLARDIIQSNDGGYIIVGGTQSEKTQSQDAYIIKIDSLGNNIWERVYGGVEVDLFSSIASSSDGYGYMVVGHTSSYMLDNSRIKQRGFIGRYIAKLLKKKQTNEVWLLSLDEYGDRNWHKTFGGKKDDVGRQIIATKDEGYIVMAETNSIGNGKNDVWLINIDQNGKKLWDKTFGNKKDDYFISASLSGSDDIVFNSRSIGKKKKSISFVVGYNKKGAKKYQYQLDKDLNIQTKYITIQNNHILLAGQKNTEFNGEGDAWIIALNNNGKQLWEESFGGRGTDGANNTLLVSDGGYLMVGYTDAYGYGKNDVQIIKTDPYGSKEWSRVYGGKKDDYGWAVTESFDSGFVIAGETFSFGRGQNDIYVIKLDSLGNKIWDNSFGGLAQEVGYAISKHDDGGYLIVGQTKSYGKGSSDGIILKINSQGQKEWEKHYGGKGLDYFNSILKDDKNNYLITGSSRSSAEGGSQAWIVNIDTDGYIIWENTYGNTGDNAFNMMKKVPEVGYIAIGTSSSFFSKGKSDVLMMQVDSMGNKQWLNYFGGKDNDFGYAITRSSDAGYAIVGETASYGNGKNDIWIIKTDRFGKKLWDSYLGGSGFDSGRSIDQTVDGGYIISGTSTISNLSFDAILIKTDTEGRYK